MILAAQVNDPGRLVGFLAVLLVSVYAVVQLLRWLLSGPIRPDPWSADIASEIEGDAAAPLCHRCLAPHNRLANFCPECGAAVGTYTNWLPFPYLFSIGHTLRIGTSGDFKRSPLTILGFLAFGLLEYAFFAPIYWFVFLRNLLRSKVRGSPSDDTPDASADTQG